MKKTLFILIVIMLLCIGTVNAWQIKSDKYVGEVMLFTDGTGFIQVDGHGSAEFTWNTVRENQFEAHYWFYTVPFKYDPERDIITSPSTDAILVR